MNPRKSCYPNTVCICAQNQAAVIDFTEYKLRVHPVYAMNKKKASCVIEAPIVGVDSAGGRGWRRRRRVKRMDDEAIPVHRQHLLLIRLTPLAWRRFGNARVTESRSKIFSTLSEFSNFVKFSADQGSERITNRSPAYTMHLENQHCFTAAEFNFVIASESRQLSNVHLNYTPTKLQIPGQRFILKIHSNYT